MTIKLNIDGREVTVDNGATVMDAATKLGIFVPHFCYHKKLTIAANCRMCLVDVEKAPKPMPACATPVTAGMIVRTASAKAVQAQKGVMEFLLINHPLDCPICDQGGECQLQDLAVGYGGSSSRYEEEKRVVVPKDAGPLISMREMARCIHCTRCVRFGQEVAGVMEFGMLNVDERLTRPMIKQDGKWMETDWQTALEYVAHGLRNIRHEHGADAIAALATPGSTLEELALLKKLVNGIGSDNVDFRLRQSDFA